jgi:glycosyltransferase involved in cell wall biosynthesis
MKFSIITPSYNQGRFLPDCVESVLSQTGVEVEHIVTDAGSTDETLDVLRRYPHLNWTSEPDKGMSDGINKGFLKASGDWLMWLNCDDYLLPGALEKVTRFIESRPEADVVHGDCVFSDVDKRPIRRKFDHPLGELVLLYTGCYIPSTATFFRREIIEAGHLLDTSYKVCMDWEYYLRLLRLEYRFEYIPQALAGFRWHGENTSMVQKSRGEREALELQREHILATHRPSWLAHPLVLKGMRQVFRTARVAKRFREHRRLF